MLVLLSFASTQFIEQNEYDSWNPPACTHIVCNALSCIGAAAAAAAAVAVAVAVAAAAAAGELFSDENAFQ